MLSRKQNKPGGRRGRYASTTSMVNNKGLLNEPGQNNCFLNSAIQVLWHLDVFRRSFRLLSGHACMGPACIFCALKNIFDQFEYSSDHALPPTVLRSALAETFQQQNRFQLGLMDDAAECFENILLRIHVHIGNTVREDVCTAAHCIPHQKFGLSLIEQCVCSSCGATSEPLPFIEMVHYVSATALCTEDEAMRQRYGSSVNYSQMFGRLIRVAGSWGDIRKCPSDCGAQIEMRKVLMNCPDVVSLGIVWDSDVPLLKNIEDLLHALGTTLKLVDLFHTVVDERAMNIELYLVGMVCYYGKHYSTFFFHTKLRKWVYFDDAQVSEVGKRWGNVITKCIKGHHQPLLLLYANPKSTPICTNTAPTTVTMLPGYSGAQGQNKFVQEDVMRHEYDSVASDGESMSYADEESSGTESMQASNLINLSPSKTKPLKQTKVKATKEQTSKVKEMASAIQNQSDHLIQRKKKTQPQTHQPPKNTSNNPPGKEKTGPSKIIGRKAAPEIQRKPKFQWNVTNDQKSSDHSEKVGQYVEPNPAQWTKYQPYSQQNTKQGHRKPPSSSNEQASKDIPNFNEQNNKQVSVKAVGNNGMATFCITSNTSEPSSSPSLSLRSSQSHSTVNSVESKMVKRSPVSKIRKTSSQSSYNTQRGRITSSDSQSSEISDSTTSIQSSSMAPISSLTNSSVTSQPVKRLSQPGDRLSESSTNRPSTQITKKDSLKEENLHGPQFLQYKTSPSDNNKKTKPPLPPKPPFLSKPLTTKSISPDKPTLNVPSVICNMSNILIPTSLNSAKQELISKIANSSQSSITQNQTKNAVTPPACVSSLFQILAQQSTNDLKKNLCTSDKLAIQVKCAALLRDADSLMVESKAADAAMDYSSALQLCLEATKVVETILMMEGVLEEHLMQARLKHGDFINKSRILQRRKNIRRQSLEKGSGKDRSSMTEADRHIASNHTPVTASNHNMELVKHFEENLNEDHLINFDKPGVSHLQHGIDQMYEEQKQIRQHSNYREPIGLISSNTNNNNNLKPNLRPESPESNKQDPSNPRTNIFVWNSPVKDKKGGNPNLQRNKQHVSSADIQKQNKVLRQVSSENSLDSKVETLSKNDKDKRTDDEIVESTKSLTLDVDLNKRFRSKTPTPQTYSEPMSVSQQRRSKTPTPASNKAMLRSHLGRQSNMQRPRSSYNFSSTTMNNELPTTTPHHKQGLKSENNSSSNSPVETPPNPMYPMMQYPYPHWGNMGKNYPMPYPPQQFYPYFYETMMKKFYESLTTEQKKQAAEMYSMNNNMRAIGPTQQQQMPNLLASQSSMQEKYTEALKSQLSKNLPHFTSHLGNIAPGSVNNIYEANKPKPVPRNTSDGMLPRDSKRTKSPTANGPNKPFVNSANPHQKQTTEKNIKPPQQSTNDAQTSKSWNKSSVDRSSKRISPSYNPPPASSSIQINQNVAPTKSQGMMKWAEEGKRRETNSKITPEYKNKLLHDFASRTNKNYTTMKKNALQNYPKEQNNTNLNNNCTNQQHHQNTKEAKCYLCGLVAVESQGAYCLTCRAYLTRFKPTVNSQR